MGRGDSSGVAPFDSVERFGLDIIDVSSLRFLAMERIEKFAEAQRRQRFSRKQVSDAQLALEICQLLDDPDVADLARAGKATPLAEQLVDQFVAVDTDVVGRMVLQDERCLDDYVRQFLVAARVAESTTRCLVLLDDGLLHLREATSVQTLCQQVAGKGTSEHMPRGSWQDASHRRCAECERIVMGYNTLSPVARISYETAHYPLLPEESLSEMRGQLVEVAAEAIQQAVVRPDRPAALSGSLPAQLLQAADAAGRRLAAQMIHEKNFRVSRYQSIFSKPYGVEFGSDKDIALTELSLMWKRYLDTITNEDPIPLMWMEWPDAADFDEHVLAALDLSKSPEGMQIEMLARTIAVFFPAAGNYLLLQPDAERAQAACRPIFDVWKGYTTTAGYVTDSFA